MHIQFCKYQATGNDFVLLDNRDQSFDGLNQESIALLCDRRFGIGADGLMTLNNKEGYDFEMKYFNADGAPGSMCGNGGRCIVAFASRCGIDQDEYKFLAYDGDHLAKKISDGVSLKMNDVAEIRHDGDAVVLDTGSPHYISFVKDVEGVDVFNRGKGIRNSDKYISKGINVNFVEQVDADTIYVRTFERGVEDETFSCGTGVTASALASATDANGRFEFRIKTKGGKLSVSFDKGEDGFKNIWLTGPADFVFSGEINLYLYNEV